MITAEQREMKFREELKDLLDRNGADLEVTDDRRPWGLHSGVCNIVMTSIYDDQGKLMADSAEFEL